MTVENLLFMITGGVCMFMVFAAAGVIIAIRSSARDRQLQEDDALTAFDAEQNEKLAARIRAAGPARWVTPAEMAERSRAGQPRPGPVFAPCEVERCRPESPCGASGMHHWQAV